MRYVKIIAIGIITIFLLQNTSYSFSEGFIKANLRKPLDFNDKQSSLKYTQALRKFELSEKFSNIENTALKEEARKGRLEIRDIAVALEYYSEEELSDFFSHLNRFEEYLHKLIGEYPTIGIISICVGKRELGTGGLGVRPNFLTLFIDPAVHRDLLKEADYDLAHGYAHILLGLKDIVYRSLPEEIKREVDAKKDLWDRRYWFNENSVSSLIFAALIDSEGFNHPIFGKIQLGEDISAGMLLEFEREDLLYSVIELMAIRVSRLITNDIDSFRKQEYQILAKRVKNFKEFNAKQVRERSATLAADIVWSKMLGYEELTSSLIKLTEGWPEEKRVLFNGFVEKMEYLWDCFSLNKPITAGLKDALKNTHAVSNNL